MGYLTSQNPTIQRLFTVHPQIGNRYARLIHSFPTLPPHDGTIHGSLLFQSIAFVLILSYTSSSG